MIVLTQLTKNYKMAFELFKQAFFDNFFELYFYIFSSPSCEFYLAIFFNLVAIFYFLFMLYLLNVITFLRYNFLNNIFMARWLRYAVRLGFNVSEEDYPIILRELAFYGYLILTGLEVLIKSSFILIVGWLSLKFPYLNFDPEPSSSWKFADFFTKSRFYVYRSNSTQSGPSSVRGYNIYSTSGDFDRGVFLRDFYPPKNFIQFQDPYTHFSKRLENASNSIWKSFRYRQRILLFERARILSNRHYNWSTHVGGSRLDQSFLSEISVPRHFYEAPKVTFFRAKSLELRQSNDLFSKYYRIEDASAPISSRRRFLSRFWLPGKNSKNMTSSLFRDAHDEQEKKMRMHNRERPIMHLPFQIWETNNVDPLLARYASKLKQRKISAKDLESFDPFKVYKEEVKDRVSDRAKIRWSDYSQFLEKYDSPLDDFDGEDFNFYYDDSEEVFKNELNVSSFYFSYGGERTVFEPEEVEFRRYLRRLANLPTNNESRNLLVRSRLNAPHTQDIPARESLMEDSSVGWHSSESKTKKSVYFFRGNQIYRRGLLDFVGMWIIKLFHKSTDFSYSKSFSRTRSPFKHGSVISDDIFGVKIDDLAHADKLREQALFDDKTHPLFWRGRQDLSSLYGSAGNSYDFLCRSHSPISWYDRPGSLSFFDVPVHDRSKLADLQFKDSSRDRLLVNRGFFASSERDIGEPLFRKIPRRGAPVYKVGDYSFYFQFVRLVYRFISDHFLFWIRAIINYFGFSNHLVPIRLASFRPGSNFERKSLFSLAMRSLYFIRKLFRIITFRGLSSNNPELRPRRDLSPFGEIDDFTMQVLFRTLSSLFFRIASLFLLFLACSLNTVLNNIVIFSLSHPLGFAALLTMVAAMLFKLYRPNYDSNLSWTKRFRAKVVPAARGIFLVCSLPFRLFGRLVKSIIGLASRQGFAVWHARDVNEDEVSYQMRMFTLYVDNLTEFLEFLRKFVFRGARASAEFDQFVSRFRTRSMAKVSDYLILFRRLIKAFFVDCLSGLWGFAVAKLLSFRFIKTIRFLLGIIFNFFYLFARSFYRLFFSFNMVPDRVVFRGSIPWFTRLRMRWRLAVSTISLLFGRIAYTFWFLVDVLVRRSLQTRMYERTTQPSFFFAMLALRLRAYGRVVALFFKAKVLRKIRFKIEETMWDIRSWFDS